MVTLVASVALFAAAISALALLGPWRTRLFGPLVVVCTATVTVLTVDLMTGSRLQLCPLMGLQTRHWGQVLWDGQCDLRIVCHGNPDALALSQVTIS
jgi:hypothetical protein